MLTITKRHSFVSIFLVFVFYQFIQAAEYIEHKLQPTFHTKYATDQEYDYLLDALERGEIGVTIPAPSRNMSGIEVVDAVALFGTSLCEPLTSAATQAAQYVQRVFAQDGTGMLMDRLETGQGVEDFNYGLKDKAKDVAEELGGDLKGAFKGAAAYPLDALSIGLASVTGWTGIAKVAPQTVTLLTWAVEYVRNSKMAQSIDGQDVTRKALKVLLLGAAVYVIASVPVAMAQNELFKGTFLDNGSCVITSQAHFKSTDPNLKGEFVALVAQCAYDREAHGLKSNELVMPLGGTCGYLHNNNGTIVGTESPVFYPSQRVSIVGKEACPELKGTHIGSCQTTAEAYQSTDSRIPEGSICYYKIYCKRMGDVDFTKRSAFDIPKAVVQCFGERLENCDGKLVFRKSGESVHQCEDPKVAKVHGKDEL